MHAVLTIVLGSKSKSSYEVNYGELNLQPLLYQDDIFRQCSNPFSAQIGNELIDAMMETKLLDFNLDKSCYIVAGPKERLQDALQGQRVDTFCKRIMHLASHLLNCIAI